MHHTTCRRFVRFSTGSGYGVRFACEGRDVVGAQLKNLGAGGCGVQLDMEQVGTLDVGSRLEGFYLIHPRLPFVPLEGQIVRMLGKIPGKTTGYVLIGIEFTAITPLVQVLIHSHVEKSLREQVA